MTTPATDSSYERFLAARADYIARERAASEDTEKLVTAGAAGALALSVAFMEKIAPTPLASTKWILGLGWILLLLALGASLASHVVRSMAYKKARELLDETAGASTPDWLPVTTLNVWHLRLLYARLTTLLLGIALVVIFAYLNVGSAPLKEVPIAGTRPDSLPALKAQTTADSAAIHAKPSSRGSAATSAAPTDSAVRAR